MPACTGKRAERQEEKEAQTITATDFGRKRRERVEEDTRKFQNYSWEPDKKGGEIKEEKKARTNM